MRLIDADDLRYDVLHYREYGPEIANYYLDLIDATPTIDAALVVRGKWEKDRIMYFCSCCNGFSVAYISPKYNYCPNCGAKMEAEVIENE